MDEGAKRMRIRVSENGPYLVSGGAPLLRVSIETNEAGESVAWHEGPDVGTPGDSYSLCRCGHSACKPFCDGSHIDADFEGTETAGHRTYAEISVPIEGPSVLLRDARKLCAEARFCDRAGGLWNLVDECDDEESLALAREEASLCPSGRYVLHQTGTGETVEPDLPASIGLVEDPQLGVSGPLFVRGGIPVHDAEATPYELRNRVTLCRCGRSNNKPFCDGSHIAARFVDESALDHE